jgi:xylulokinase
VWPATSTETYEADPIPFVRERYAEVRDLTASRARSQAGGAVL